MPDVIEYFSKTASDFHKQYSTEPEFDTRMQVWAEAVRRHGSQCHSALDVGCGSGVLSMHLAEQGMRVLGVDASEAMIELCRQRLKTENSPNAIFELGALPFNNIEWIGKVDLIVCSSVLEYVEDLETSLGQFHAILKPGGIAMFSLPNASSLYRKAERVAFGLTGKPAYRRFLLNEVSPGKLQPLLQQIGFRILDVRYFARISVLSQLAGMILPQRYIDTMFLVICQRV